MSENKKELNQENLDKVSGGLYWIPGGEGEETKKKLNQVSAKKTTVILNGMVNGNPGAGDNTPFTSETAKKDRSLRIMDLQLRSFFV